MKRIITLFASLAIAYGASAQTDSPLVFDTQGDNLGISVAGFNISLGANKDKSTSAAKTPKRMTTNFAGISYGANVLTYEPNYGNWAGESDFMTDDVASSRLGCEALGLQISLNRSRTLFVKASLNASIDYFRFKEAMTMAENENGALMPQPLSGMIKKSKMVASYLGAGAGFGFEVSKLKVTFDFNVDVLVGSYVKYKNPDKTKYHIGGFSNIRYRPGVSVSLDDLGIYADYSLTPLFKEGVGNDGRVLSVGVRVGF